MKKFTVKAIAVALASVCGSAAFAGSITLPAATTKYAVQSLIGTTDVTLPTVRYQMGVARTTAQDFTVIIKPTAGASFTAASCTAGLPTITLGGAATGAFTATIKRASTSECAYEIDVTTAFSAPSGADVVSLNFAGLVLDSHTLNVAGNTAGITVGLWDLGETARIDNSTDLTATTAESGNALTLTATQDTATVADVNATGGPLFGFLANGTAPADTATVASARFVLGNNVGGTWLLPDGATAWDFNLHGTGINVTIAGTNFTGLHATTPVTVTVPAGAAPTVTTGASTATFTLLPANITGGNVNHNIDVNMTAAGNASLGTSRTFGVSAVADVQTGADLALAGNATWWVWSANAIQLSTAFSTTDSGAGLIRRFFFQNTGTSAATYTATCAPESAAARDSFIGSSGNAAVTAVAGDRASGSLFAGQTVIDASRICTLTGASRTTVTFTINAPAANIKGVFMTAPNGGTPAFIALERPYAGSTY